MAGVKGRSGRKRKYMGEIPAKQRCAGPCGEVKAGTMFHRNKARSSGIERVCIECSTVVKLSKSYRREIRRKGIEAFQDRIHALEDRLTLMNRALHQAQKGTKQCSSQSRF